MSSSIGSASLHRDPDSNPQGASLEEEKQSRSDSALHVLTDSDKTVIRQTGVFDVSSDSMAPSLFGRGPLHQLIGHQLDHFLIESLVGSGGMGAVYRGRDLRLDRVVAIKVVSIGDRGADAMRRFRIEAQSAAKLDHPNIARVFYVGETEQWSYIVFEYVEGTNLRDIVLSQGTFSVDEAICLTRQVAEALQHAHERRVVHRDIKPSNILLTESGNAKIVDMGLARTTELDRSTNDLTASGVTLGTFDYISPEQAHDPRDADSRSDIYSLGCTLYFLLTGQPPFPDGTALQKLLLHGTTMPEDPRFFRSDLSDSLIAVLRKMMAKRPSDRYQEPNDLVNDLQTLAEVDGLQRTMARDIVSSRPTSNQRTWVEAVLPFAICLATILAIATWLHNESLSAYFQIPARPDFSPEELASNAPPGNIPANTNQAAPVEPRTTPNLAPNDRPPANSNKVVGPTQEANIKGTSPESTERTIPRSDVGATQLVIVDPDATSFRTTQSDSISIVRSIEEALSLIHPKSSVHRIQLRTKQIRLSPVTWKGVVPGFEGIIAIESFPGTRCRWVIEPAQENGSPTKCWIPCDDRSVRLQGIDIVWGTQLAPAESLFSLKPRGALSLKDTTITVQHDQRTVEPCIIAIEGDSIESGLETNASQPTTIPIRIAAQHVCVRGQCDWLRMSTPIRTEMQVDNAWFAISGRMLDLRGSRTSARSMAMLRMEWVNVSAYSARSWMRLMLTNSHPNPIAIIRTARDCVFAGSPSLLEWDASSCTQWSFWEQPNRLEELARWVDLRGMDNAYDSSSIQSLFSVQLPSKQNDTIRFDGDSQLLREERGLESVVRWIKAPRIDPNKLHEQLPETFELLKGTFQPGFVRDKLPIDGLSTALKQ